MRVTATVLGLAATAMLASGCCDQLREAVRLDAKSHVAVAQTIDLSMTALPPCPSDNNVCATAVATIKAQTTALRESAATIENAAR